MKLLYFAWVRERVGKTEETVVLPPEVQTVSDLIAWLGTRGEEYAYAFENPAIIRAAVDQRHAASDTALFGAREVALFPPMTGG